jgi:hypothetical protein
LSLKTDRINDLDNLFGKEDKMEIEGNEQDFAVDIKK